MFTDQRQTKGLGGLQCVSINVLFTGCDKKRNEYNLKTDVLCVI